MTIQKTLGGDRLGSGKKEKISLHNFERSNHDLGFVWRNTQSVGTLVPFMSLVGLPGDTFDIDLDAVVKTLPAQGPLFGSFKLQLDVFTCPMRLFNGKLHSNKIGIGMSMKDIKLPLISVSGKDVNDSYDTPIDIQQISPSSLLAYLGLRGIGIPETNGGNITRKINGVPYLSMFEIYKNYYANKQEGIGAILHTTAPNTYTFRRVRIEGYDGGGLVGSFEYDLSSTNGIVNWQDWTANATYLKLHVWTSKGSLGDGAKNLVFNGGTFSGEKIKDYCYISMGADPKLDYCVIVVNPQSVGITWDMQFFQTWDLVQIPKIETFPLANLDTMREDIMAATKATSAFEINASSIKPYGLPLGVAGNGQSNSQFTQEGLLLKTYQSDIFNNWLSTTYVNQISGDSLSAISNVDTSKGYFSIDTLNISQKVYTLMNRVIVSGGSYYDWIEAVYGQKPYEMAETPIYCGGLSKEIVFQEVVNTAKGDNPLGDLGGRGTMSGKHKGGKVVIKVNAEPSYIMGIVSITPRIDYSQGNSWDIDLKTMDDFHKPSLDQIGFQGLITEQMAWWDTVGGIKVEAGKQPAWINYMTNFNKCYGNFAIENNQMFMTLNRRYERNPSTRHIKDLTTYIDPAKYNQIFADSSLDAQNFWVQIGCDINARRKMSAKQMPNL